MNNGNRSCSYSRLLLVILKSRIAFVCYLLQ